MDFNSDDYRNTDFRNEEQLYTRFYYNEVSTAPGLTWCTEYFYRKMPDGKYRLVEIDSWDNELYCHNEYSSAKDFADDIKNEGCAEEEVSDYLFDIILSLCPEDVKKHEEELRGCFDEKSASLLEVALDDGDRALVKALLPDFAQLREHLYPTPYIPGISVKELNRRKEMLREHYRKSGYVEESPDCFVLRQPRACWTVAIGEYEVHSSARFPVGCGGSSTLLEDIKEVSDVR